jgi:DNA-binding GntR family transcriptional regulator
VASASGNPELQTAIERQRSTFFVLANAVLLPAPYDEFPNFADEHREIAAAIHAHDAPGARSEMDAHLARVHTQFAYALARATAEVTRPGPEGVETFTPGEPSTRDDRH